MLSLPRLIILVVVVNVLIAGLLHGWGYDFLDRYVYQQKELLYQQALKQTQETFTHIEPEQWNPLSDELGVRFGSGSIIHTRDSKDLPPKVLDYISDKIGSEGFVDPFEPYVYYPLGENHVFILGPLSLATWQQYVIEWATLLASVIACVAIILFYHKRLSIHLNLIYQRLEQLRADQLPESNQTEVKRKSSLELSQIYQQIRQIQQEQILLQANSKQQIESQRDLLHGVAHEFRSPMARMQFALDMLDEGEQAEREQMVNKLSLGIEELDDLVKELLSYSRIKHLNQQLEFGLVKVGYIVEQSIEKVASFYPDVTFEFDGDLDAEVMVDERLLQRAFANILRNAGRFSHRICQVHVHCVAERLVVDFEDDGDGIPPGKRERIFEPFTRLDPSRSRDSGGTGLGLAIVQSIVERHQGTVKVDDSESLGGACFRVEIPLAL